MFSRVCFCFGMTNVVILIANSILTYIKIIDYNGNGMEVDIIKCDNL